MDLLHFICRNQVNQMLNPCICGDISAVQQLLFELELDIHSVTIFLNWIFNTIFNKVMLFIVYTHSLT